MSGKGNLAQQNVEPIGETLSRLGSVYPEGPREPDRMGMASLWWLEVGLKGQDDTTQGIETLCT